MWSTPRASAYIYAISGIISLSTGQVQKPINANFETSEHTYLGDLTNLQFPNNVLAGGDFNFSVGKKSLSYGQIVALAGDFFGSWQWVDCSAQTSDGYDTDPQASVQRFKKIALSMLDKRDELECIARTVQDMSQQVCNAIGDGEDVVQTYKKLSPHFNTQFGSCDVGYLHLALCNWDHFGQDAINAYKAGHYAALSQAASASKDKDIEGLRKAYFFEAYAQHWLTDLFSAGHLRTPRRILHQSFEHISNPWPADLCSKEMHDEDSDNGLWVTNALGESWAVYGDKELSLQKSYQNVDKAVEAAQLGVDEVWAAFHDGSAEIAQPYKALQKVPDIKNLVANHNFAPMFRYDDAFPTNLGRRQNLADRSSRSTLIYERSTLKQKSWEGILAEIQNSAPKSNSYPANVDGFLPETILKQYKAVNGSHLSLNVYGPVNSRNYMKKVFNFCKKKAKPGKYRRSWTLVSQTILKNPLEQGFNVSSALRTQNGDIVLSGVLESDSSRTGHVALRNNYVVWSLESSRTIGQIDSIKLQNVQFTSNIEAIVEQRKIGSGVQSSLYTFDKGSNERPVEKAITWELPSEPIATFSLPSDLSSLSELHVSITRDTGSRGLTWTLTHWDPTLQTINHTTIHENLTFHSSPYIIHDGPRILRLFYQAESSRPVLKLEVLSIKVSLSRAPEIVVLSTQSFPVTWGLDHEHVTITLVPTQQSASTKNLVVLLNDRVSASLSTIIFPASSSSSYPDSLTFADPKVSSITPPGKVQTYTATYLQSLAVAPAEITQLETGKRVKGALVQLFSNYGMLGVRLLRPREDGYGYEAGGQIPSVAGQTVGGDAWILEAL